MFQCLNWAGHQIENALNYCRGNITDSDRNLPRNGQKVAVFARKTNPPTGNCHQSAVYWLNEAGYNVPDWWTINPINAAAAINQGAATRVRNGGVINTPPGSIIAFLNPNYNNQLSHSMIAIDSNTWIGVNNINTFGTGLDKHIFNLNAAIQIDPGVGNRVIGIPYWSGNNNQFIPTLPNMSYEVVYYDPDNIH